MADLEAAGRELLQQVLAHLRKAVDLAQELEQRVGENRLMADALNRRVGDTGDLMAQLRDETEAGAQLMRTGLAWSTGKDHWEDESAEDIEPD